MTATDIATTLVPALLRQGFAAVRHADPTPNGFAHKITLSEQEGPALGNIVIYAGHKGPRYTINELRHPTPHVQARLAQAWADIGLLLTNATLPNTTTPSPTAPVPADMIELWVDGACLQESNGLRFGWAYVIRRGNRELTRYASHHIEPSMIPHRNVAAELQAVRHGLEHCRLQGYSRITVFYDYTGIEQWGTGRWKANTHTTQDYAAYIRNYPGSITWHKVAAHTGIPMNELVDSLATEAARHALPQTLPSS